MRMASSHSERNPAGGGGGPGAAADRRGHLYITYLHKVKISRGAQSQATKGLISGVWQVTGGQGRRGRLTGALGREEEGKGGSRACLQ